MSPEQSATSYIIWLVRVVVPIILFFVWYKSQTKEDQEEDGPAYDRDELVAVRQAAGCTDAPPSLRSLKLMEETELQKLGFAGAAVSAKGARRDRDGAPGGGKGGGKAKGSGKGGGSSVELAAASKSGGTSGGGGIGVGVGGGGSEASKKEAVQNGEKVPLLPDEDRDKLQSLLTWVAFSHKDRPQRYFLPDKALGCAPPIPKPPLVAPTPLSASEASAKANSEAQAVLQGLNLPKLGLQCSSIAQALYHKMQEEKIQIAEATFVLMVDASVSARDLKLASELLMKMESNGYCPNSAMLDKVMDLYAAGDNDASKDSDGPDSSDCNGHGSKPKYLFADSASPLASGQGRVGLSNHKPAVSSSEDRTPSKAGTGLLSTPTSLRPGGAGSLSSSLTAGISLRPGGGTGMGTPVSKKAAPWAKTKTTPPEGAKKADDMFDILFGEDGDGNGNGH